MTAHRGESLQAAFEALLNCPTEERTVLLQKLPPSLRREVASLLRHDESGSAAGYLDTPREAGPVALSLELSPGEQVPGYEILEVLGKGGMGIVYKARQLAVNRLVALKMVQSGSLAGEAELARFRSEAEALGRLQHPNIVQVFEVGEWTAAGQTRLPFFTLEYVKGGTLAQRLSQGPLPPRPAAELVRTLALALQAAHDAGIVHRDLKPANILIADCGVRSADSQTQSALRNLQSAIPKIADFGLAKRLDDDSGQTQTGTILGTPSYMSPEQAAGAANAVGPLSDLYALGAVLFECLTGSPLFKGATPLATLELVRDREPLRPSQIQPAVSRDLDTICLKCLHKQAEKRYASAAALAEDLRRYLAGEPILARPVSRLERGWRWCRRNPAVALLTVAVILSLVIGIVTATTFAVLASQRAEAERVARTAAEQDAYFQSILAADFAWRDGQVSEMQRLLDRCPTPLRRWEWDYLQRTCNGQEKLFRTDARGVADVAISPDGTRLAASGRDARIRVWEVATGQLLRSIPHTLRQTHLAFRGDGSLLACSLGNEGEVRIWEPETGRELLSVVGHRTCAAQAACSSDCRLVATASVEGQIKIWNLHDRSVRAMQHGPNVSVNALAFRPDGRQLASSSLDSTVILWDVATGSEVLTFRGHHKRVHSLVFSPDGKWIASASAATDNRKAQEPAEVFVWNAETGLDVTRLEGVTKTVSSVVFSADGKTLATAGYDRTIRLWPLPSGKETILVRGHQFFNALALTSDGRLASASEDGTVRLWDVRREQRCQTLSSAEVRTASSLAFSSDGRHLLTGHLSGEVALWDLDTKRSRVVPASHGGKVVQSIALHPNDLLAASAGRDGVVRLWDTPSMQPLGAALPHGDHVQTVAFSPDGVWLASGGRDCKVRLWDVGSRQCRYLLLGHTDTVQRVAFSPDGTRLASCGDDRSVRLWNVADGQLLAQWRGQNAPITCIAFSPDGRRLVSGAGTEDAVAHLWDLETLTIQSSYRGHTLKMTGLAFTPDGERLVTSSDDCTMRLWEVKTGREVLTWCDHKDGVNCVAFSRDGRRLASGGWDRIVRVWETSLPLR